MRRGVDAGSDWKASAGIKIIHINTELRLALRRSLEDSLKRQPNEILPY
jgi:hypothetical protein